MSREYPGIMGQPENLVEVNGNQPQADWLPFPAVESDVLAIAHAWLSQGHAAALATVVAASGSAPRQVGSHIVVRDDGAFAGSVSAGCVENAVIELALAVMADGQNRRARFGVSDGVFAPGLMCGGEIEILIEPLIRTAMLAEILAARRSGRVLVRVLDLDSGAEQLIDPATDTTPLGRLAAQAAEQDASRAITFDGRRLFLTVYNTPWEIVIVGAVHIAQALAHLAMAGGYRVRVIDPRAPYASQERFAGITVIRDWPDAALAQQPLTPRSALIVLAHDPKLDDAGLAAAIRSPAFYIGALGSARTHARRLARLTEAGFTPAELSRVHGPVGLALGARSPSEIAISILAQLVQVRRAPRPRIAGIVLAAGTSTRMGANKLVMPFKGAPLVRHAVEAALAAHLDPVIVVTGHEETKIQQALADMPAQFVYNGQYAQGLSTSLRAGIRAVPTDCDGALVLLGDMPAITPDLCARVVARFDPASGHAICVAAAPDGTRGHPVLWGRQFFTAIEALTGDQGAKEILARHADQVVEVAAGDNAPLLDIDTPEALNRHSR